MENSTHSNNPERGLTPTILLDQVRNTVPFIFAPDFEPRPDHRYLTTLLSAHADPGFEPSHAEYFKLCLSAHHATVASFVPTDVDNQIRHKLWSPALSIETVLEMARTVEESLTWSHSQVSARTIIAPSGKVMSGHLGEWFSTAAAAYGALKRRDPKRASEIADLIAEQVIQHSEIYREYKTARDGVGLLKCATLIAHNLGDLDRVIDAWNLPQDDALRLAVYKAGHSQTQAGGKVLLEAGALNKAQMADENHRHFALRPLKCLRRSADLLLPIGPFFDAWGSRLTRAPQLSPEEIGQITEALIEGWERLKGPVGYARALTGILDAFPGGAHRLSQYLPSKTHKTLMAGLLRNLCSVSKTRFEEQWGQAALRFKHS